MPEESCIVENVINLLHLVDQLSMQHWEQQHTVRANTSAIAPESTQGGLPGCVMACLIVLVLLLAGGSVRGVLQLIRRGRLQGQDAVEITDSSQPGERRRSL